MRIVFMGTPEFSVAFLQHLQASSHQLVAVVTQPDRPAGRGRQLAPPPVKVAAQALELPVLQPTNLRDPALEAELRAFQADLFVVVAFSILPKNLLGASRSGAVNLHGSLLPCYRGAAPVQWAVANGDPETGVTVFLLDEKMDHGPILVQERLPIGPEETGAEVLARMASLGCIALDKALEGLQNGQLQSLPQNHGAASPAPKLRKEDGRLDWNKSAQELHNRIRAFQPWPGGYTILRGRLLHIHRCLACPEKQDLAPGFVQVDAGRMWVGTGVGALELLNVQAEGRKPMSVSEFVRGLQSTQGLQCL
ncbi:MAG TPA: methionyl-tRNA formyltransferase [Fibrobacteraceae bacterium]|nr:methionyl-tRNA formyltransferase [Fibrobacteraceae bacterium]